MAALSAKAKKDGKQAQSFIQDAKFTEIHEMVSSYLASANSSSLSNSSASSSYLPASQHSLFVMFEAEKIAVAAENYGISAYSHSQVGLYEPGFLFTPVDISLRIDDFEVPARKYPSSP